MQIGLRHRLRRVFHRVELALGREGSPDRTRIAALLGLQRDFAYSRQRALDREWTISQISGCSPADTTPAALSGYVHESGLRFFHTLEAVDVSVRQFGSVHPRLLEIGSNPYFLTLLMAERFPGINHLGVNYFGAQAPRMESQDIVDDKRRLSATRFLHADVERHDLEQAGVFDLALFCEVLEHLPYDPAWALYNISRRLRPGGHMILTTPNPARFENIVRLVEKRETFSDPVSAHGIHGRHNREYSAAELCEMLTGTGFRIMEARTIDVFPDAYSREAERRGYGSYHLVRGALTGAAQLFRPAWLYRGFSPESMKQPGSLAPSA